MLLNNHYIGNEISWCNPISNDIQLKQEKDETSGLRVLLVKIFLDGGENFIISDHADLPFKEELIKLSYCVFF